MLALTKPRSRADLERRIDKYKRKMATAKSPTQHAYAFKMMRDAEYRLDKQFAGVKQADPVVDLHPGDYTAS